MDVSIKQFECFACEFNALQSGAVINVEDVEVDNNALEQALKQIIDDHCLTQSAQRVCIRKFTVRQDDYEKLIGSNFYFHTETKTKTAAAITDDGCFLF